jgi:hypothetical protein
MTAIWHFTLYWTLILIGGIFVLCSLLASLSLLLSQTVYDTSPKIQHPLPTDQAPKHNAPFHSGSPSIPSAQTVTAGKVIRPLRKRPPLWPIFLIPIVVGAVAAIVALISGTVVGFVLAAIYSAGGFSMST